MDTGTSKGGNPESSTPLHTMKIRLFAQLDTAEVVALWRDCGLTRSWNKPERDIQRKCSVADDLFLVAEQDGNVVGTVMGGYDGHRGWINYLAVSPKLRKQGLGKRLMDEVESRLLARGCPKINLQVRAGNTEVVAFYEAIGFSDDKVMSLGKRLIADD